MNDTKQIVKRLLRQLKITFPPIPVENIANHLGVKIEEAILDGEISGFLYKKKKNGQAVIAVNALHSRHSYRRKRFTIAHELGHLILKHHGEFFVDRKLFRDSISKQGTDKIERDANQFAAELLMPELMIRAQFKETPVQDVDDPESLKLLADRFEVSVQAMTIRLANLGLVSL